MFWKLCALVALASLVAVGSALAGSERAGATTNVNVTAGKPSELKFTLSKKSVPKGTIVFKVTNRGVLAHDFRIAGKKTKMLAKGKSATLRVTVSKARKYAYLCTVPGHAAGGMKGVLTVR
jgi:uncharacterized cupredoxin-like copper-binding protein